MATPGAAEEDSLLAAIPKKVLPPWDPLTSLDWDKEKHSSVALVRIQRWEVDLAQAQCEHPLIFFQL